MKPVQINFVPDTRWRRLWAAAALCVLGLIGTAGWYVWQINAAIKELEARIGTAQQQLKDLRLPSPTDPRYASAEQAARLLQQDLNKAFAAVENLKEPGVRLRNLHLDAAANALRLEYELDSVGKASTITELLNTGYDNHPWQLESVNTAGGSTQAGFMPMAQAVRGIWAVQLGKL